MLSSQEIEEIIIQRHNKAEAIMSLFHMGVNVLLFYLSINKLGYDPVNKSSPKNKIFIFIILDIFFRATNVLTSSINYSFTKEIFINCITSTQLYIIIIFLNQIFLNKKLDFSSDANEIKNPHFAALFFYMLSFKIDYSKYFSLFQNVIISIIAPGYVFYVSNIAKNFFENFKNPKQKFEVGNYTIIFPIFIALYFFIYYLLKIVILMVDFKLYISYLDLASLIFKEAGKYLSLYVIFVIYQITMRYINKGEANYTTNDTYVSISNDREKLNKS